MRGVRVNSNGTSSKVLAEPNHLVRNEQKDARDGDTSGGHGLSAEDESRINDDLDANGERASFVHQPLQEQLEQSQGRQVSVVCWERFLPFGSLKVLLVEYDDATRHVVSALLRNCSYEVTAVANGIEAWKILQDTTNHIDLVLTEVLMPYLSGIGLLSKMMNHRMCKNIPVIMMSSNDSMGVVFKCLSKGAVDFLVKPIRKNELKNLWQHVWRKCQRSSGSGSESGIQTQKSSKLKTIEGTGNNNVSNNEDDIASMSLNDRNGSDNGSGTQISWTKRAIEVDNSRSMSPWDELADTPDSTCALVIHLTPEAFSNNWVPTTAETELCGKKELGKINSEGDISMGKDLDIGVLRNSDTQTEDQIKAQERKNLESEIEDDGAKLEEDEMQLNGGTLSDKSSEEVADLIGTVNCVSPQMDKVAPESPGDITKMNIKEGPYDPKEAPSLELTLKRRRDVGEVEDPVHGQNVFRRSHLSAFARYNNVSTANQTLTGNVGSCSPNENSSEADKPENLQSNSNKTPNQRFNESSNNNDLGSTTNNAFAKLASDEPVPKSALKVQPCTAYQPVRSSHTLPPQPSIPNKGDVVTMTTVLVEANSTSPQVQVQHHHHHYHHHHHHVHNMQQQKEAPTSTTVPAEVNAANFNLKGSGPGSNTGSNGQSGNSGVVCAEVANIDSENILAPNFGGGAAGGSGSGNGNGNGSGVGVNQSRYAQRMAALNKFRQKRKDRCFEKKVRYQSRKKLAEQRPRVRGQFVRQGVHDNKSSGADS